MKQVVLDLSSGRALVTEAPAPNPSVGSVCIATRRSLISAGTERALAEFAHAGWLERARQQPERVKEVLSKLSTDGLLATVDAVRSKLDDVVTPGYCNVGVVLSAGSEAGGFCEGDRVVSNGPHAEIVAVPPNLCARIPVGVTDDTAAFAVLGAIALQGVRLADPTLGECFVVIGLGLLGLITVQLLRANGCSVLGLDPDPAKTALARKFGAVSVDIGRGEDPLNAAARFSRARGVDGVLITATTKSDEPISQAARMCRKRGRIVLIGVTGLHLRRSEFYEKELTFQVSCSYGPGRYDPAYEHEGHDYPVGFVRWTEQRNFEAVLDLMARGALDLEPLITHRFAIADAPRAYELLVNGHEPSLGILLEYSPLLREPVSSLKLTNAQRETRRDPAQPRLAVVGAGNYAARTLIPSLASTNAQLVAIASSGGLKAARLGRKYGFEEAVSDASRVISGANTNAVVIATRHDSHARFAREALSAGKNVFVEKPLAIFAEEVDAIEAAWSALPLQARPLLMVGFNRRFAPHTTRIKSLLKTVPAPKTFVVTVNAGALPANHWTLSATVGGGRILGEGCHFIDLMRFLADAPIVTWHVTTMGGVHVGAPDDNVSINLKFADGSIGTLHYFGNGNREFPKERVEIFCAGRVLQLDNFRRLRGYGWPGFRTMRLWRQDKGHVACAAAFVNAIRQGLPAPIPFNEIVEVARVSIVIAEAARARGARQGHA